MPIAIAGLTYHRAVVSIRENRVFLRFSHKKGAILPKVLVVDHHENKRMWLEKILTKAGHEVLCLGESEKALKEFEQIQPDAAVLTMTLPGISGSELGQKLKKTKLGKEIPVILTSPLFKDMDMRSIAQKRWKVDVFLEEPYTKSMLLKNLEEQLAAYAQKKIDAADEDAEEINPFSHLESEQVDPLDAMVAAADLVAEGLEQEETRRMTKPGYEKKAESIPEKEAEFAELAVEPEGSLGDASIPEVISAIFFARKTGILKVTVDKVSKEVYFRKGSPVFVKSALREETLGEILIRNGLISEQQRTRTLQSMAEKNLKQGDALIDIGALSPTDLYQALKLQAHEKVIGLFSWREGLYEFVEGDFPTEGITIFEMWTPLLILQGVLRHYEAPNIRQILNELKDFILSRRAAPPVAYNELRFPKEVRGLIDLVDGQRTLAQIVKDSPLDLPRTYQVLFVLLILEQFDKIDPGRKSAVAGEELPMAGISLNSLISEVFGEDAAEEAREQFESVAGLADQLEPDTEDAPAEQILDAPAEAMDDSGSIEDIEEYSEPDAKRDLAKLFAKKDAASGKWEGSGISLDMSDDKTDSGRVAFDLDDDDDMSPSDEADQKDKADDEEAKKKAFKEVDDALDDFLKDVDEKSDEPDDVMEETIRITMDDLKAEDEDEDREKSSDGDKVEHGKTGLITALDAQKERLSDEDREILDAILADYLGLSKRNHYEVLHIEKDIEDKDIRDAYTTMVKRYHPDKMQSRFSKEIIEKANEVMKRATEAYRTLSNFKKRKEYDKELETGHKKEQRSIAMVLKAENEFAEGIAQTRHMRWQQAKEHFEAAIELLPEEGEYFGYLGWSIYNLTNQPLGERTSQARENLEKAVRLNPRSDKSFYFLGMLLKDNDMLDKAALMFAQAFRINKNNFQAKNQLKAIQALRSSKPKTAAQRPRPKSQRPGARPSKPEEGFLSKDINMNSVKKAILKIFW